MSLDTPFRCRAALAITALLSLPSLLTATGCDQETAPAPTPGPASTADATPPPTTEGEPLRAVVTTPTGAFTIEFRPDVAPIACANFVNLVQRRFYDGLEFYRHSPVIRQAGNPFNDDTQRWNCGYTIAPEFSPDLRFDRGGLVALVRLTDDVTSPVRPNEFFVTTKPQSERFTFKFPAFAEVVEGLDVVQRIAKGERIDSIRLVGDPTPILAPHETLVAQWNATLDTVPDPRRGR